MSSTLTAAAENGVVNGGFEEYRQAPFLFGQLNSLSGGCEEAGDSRFLYNGLASGDPAPESPWSGCSTELFTGDGAGRLSTREPMYDYTPEVKPHSGGAMAGFVPFYRLADGSRKWFERVNGTLAAPLQVGVEYTVRFYAQDLMKGSHSGVAPLNLQVAFRSGRYRNTKEMISHPGIIPGAIDLRPVLQQDHWLKYEGKYSPRVSGQDSFVIGTLKGDLRAGSDFIPNRSDSSIFETYYFLDDVEVSCDYRLGFTVAGLSRDEKPATPEIDVRLQSLVENKMYVLEASGSWNVGAHSWNLQEVDASYRPLGSVKTFSSDLPPGTLHRSFEPRKIYKIWLNGGCLRERTDSGPIYLHTGDYSYPQRDPGPFERMGGFSCRPKVEMRLSGSEWSCGEDARVEVDSNSVSKHLWTLVHLSTGRVLSRPGTGAPGSQALSGLFPGLTGAGAYRLKLSVWCDPEVSPLEVESGFVIREIPVDFQTSLQGDSLGKGVSLRVSTAVREPGQMSYEWRFSGPGGISSRSGPEAEFSWNERGEYPVEMEVHRANGCVSSRTKNIRVVDPSIHVPDAFTPNGDGLNDTFRPVATDVSFDLQILDRWGAIVYQEHFDAANPDAFRGWDGRVQGAEPMEGVYVYQVVTHRGTRYNRRGSFTLLGATGR